MRATILWASRPAPQADAEKVERPRAKTAIAQNAANEIVYKVLTDRQRAMLARLIPVRGRIDRMFEGVTLTDEQKVKIEQIRKDGREAMGQAKTPEARRAAFRAMRAKLNEVLTEEQRKGLRERTRRSRQEGQGADPGRRGRREVPRERRVRARPAVERS